MSEANARAPKAPNDHASAEPCTGNRASGQPATGERLDWRLLAKRQAERRKESRGKRHAERQSKNQAKSRAKSHDKGRVKSRRERRAGTLKIIFRLNVRNFRECEMNPTSAFRKAFIWFCAKRGIDRSAHRFMYGSVQVSDNHTPGSLGMQEGAIIDCMIRGSSTVSPVCFRRSSLDNVVTVRPRPPRRRDGSAQ